MTENTLLVEEKISFSSAKNANKFEKEFQKQDNPGDTLSAFEKRLIEILKKAMSLKFMIMRARGESLALFRTMYEKDNLFEWFASGRFDDLSQTRSMGQ